MDKTVAVGEALSFGWETFLAHAFVFLRLQAASILLGFGPLLLGELIPGNLGYLFLLSGSLLQLWLVVGWARVALKSAAGEPVGLADLFSDGARLPAFFGAAFIAYMAVVVGLALLLAPGLFFLSAWCLFPFALVAERAGPVLSLRRSWTLTEGLRLQLLGFALLSLLLLAAGLLACGFGVLVSFPVVAVAWARTYRDLAAVPGD